MVDEDTTESCDEKARLRDRIADLVRVRAADGVGRGHRARVSARMRVTVG